MKTSIYTAIAAMFLLASAACTKSDGLSSQNSGKQRPSVEVSLTSLEDNRFSFHIKADTRSAQYAYVVLEGKDNETPDPRSILFNEVSGAMMEAAFNTADTPYVDVEIKCTSTQSYQIFATAITSTGLISDIATLDVTAPDTVIPVPYKYTYNGNVITIEFFEPVKRGTTGRVMVRHMQPTTKQLLDLIYLSEDDISFLDGNAVITCPRPQDGTMHGSVFILSFEKGAFVDHSGNECDDFWSRYNEGNDTYTGMCWQDDHENFSILPTYFSTYGPDHDWNAEDASISFLFPFDVYDAAVNDPAQVIYSEYDGMKTIYADCTLGEDRRTVTIRLPKKPEGYFDVSIKEGAFYDAWGNESNSFSPDMKNLRYCVSGLPEPVCGVYRIEDDEKPFEARFEKHDDNHIVVYANWFNIWDNKHGNPILLGTLDKARKTISFDGTFYNEGNFTGGAFGRGLVYYDADHKYMLAFWGSGRSGEDPIMMTYDDNGLITTTTAFEYAIHQTSTSVEIDSYGKVEDGTSLTFISSAESETE